MGKPRLKPPSIFVIHASASYDTGTHIEDLMAERKRRNEGYNIIIDDESAPHDGKARLAQDAPDGEVSNGTYGLNQEALNFCIDGDFRKVAPTPDEVDALVQAVAIKAKKFGWTAEYARTHIVTHNYVGLHLSPERYVTECPGQMLIDLIPHIIKRVCSYLP